jgi:hypothetical protein
MDQLNNEVDSLFASYKALVPDPEPGANFMPELWRRIEARRSLVFRVKRLTQLFVAAAAAICIAFATFLAVPPSSDNSAINGNYVEELAETNPAEHLTALGTEEFRRQYLDEMRTRLNLTPDQMGKLKVILDRTDERYDDARKQHNEMVRQLREDHHAGVRAMLTAEQLPEYEQLRAEREQRAKRARALQER